MAKDESGHWGFSWWIILGNFNQCKLKVVLNFLRLGNTIEENTSGFSVGECWIKGSSGFLNTETKAVDPNKTIEFDRNYILQVYIWIPPKRQIALVTQLLAAILRGSKGYDSYLLSNGEMEGFLEPQNLHETTVTSFEFATWGKNRVNKCHGLSTWNVDFTLNEPDKNKHIVLASLTGGISAAGVLCCDLNMSKPFYIHLKPSILFRSILPRLENGLYPYPTYEQMIYSHHFWGTFGQSAPLAWSCQPGAAILNVSTYVVATHWGLACLK